MAIQLHQLMKFPTDLWENSGMTRYQQNQGRNHSSKPYFTSILTKRFAAGADLNIRSLRMLTAKTIQNAYIDIHRYTHY